MQNNLDLADLVLSKETSLENIGFDTTKNEPLEVRGDSIHIFQIFSINSLVTAARNAKCKSQVSTPHQDENAEKYRDEIRQRADRSAQNRSNTDKNTYMYLVPRKELKRRSLS